MSRGAIHFRPPGAAVPSGGQTRSRSRPRIAVGARKDACLRGVSLGTAVAVVVVSQSECVTNEKFASCGFSF